MGLPRAYAAPFRGRTLATVGVLAALAVTVLAGCKKSDQASGGTPPGTIATTSAAAAAATPTGGTSGGGSGDWCALAERIGNEAGVMVNKHFIPLQKETLDMLKAVVNLSLA